MIMSVSSRSGASSKRLLHSFALRFAAIAWFGFAHSKFSLKVKVVVGGVANVTGLSASQALKASKNTMTIEADLNIAEIQYESAAISSPYARAAA